MQVKGQRRRSVVLETRSMADQTVPAMAIPRPDPTNDTDDESDKTSDDPQTHDVPSRRLAGDTGQENGLGLA